MNEELSAEVLDKLNEKVHSDSYGDLQESNEDLCEKEDREGSEEEESENSDVDSCHSMYQLADKRVPFVSLNVMILMEYTEGETLRDIIDKFPEYLTRGMIFTLFTQMMTALKKIHSIGLIHRDIKPENIFVNRKTNAL